MIIYELRRLAGATKRGGDNIIAVVSRIYRIDLELPTLTKLHSNTDIDFLVITSAREVIIR